MEPLLKNWIVHHYHQLVGIYLLIHIRVVENSKQLCHYDNKSGKPNRIKIQRIYTKTMWIILVCIFVIHSMVSVWYFKGNGES